MCPQSGEQLPPPQVLLPTDGAVGQSGSLSDVALDDVDGPDANMMQLMRKAEIDKVHLKIQKTMERIKAEQREKEGT